VSDSKSLTEVPLVSDESIPRNGSEEL